MDITSGQIYRIINVKAVISCIDVTGENNDKIIGNALNDGRSQRWLFEDTGLGWTLKSVGTGKYVGRMGVGDSLLAMACDEPVTWDVWPDEQFYDKYRIFVHGTRYNLDLSNHGNATPGTPIALWSRWQGLNQLWSIEPAD